MSRWSLDKAYGRRGGNLQEGASSRVVVRDCDVCSLPTAQGRRHASCDPKYPLAGMVCVCPPGCTTGPIWGDGPRECRSVDGKVCEPCTIMAGRPYKQDGT